MSAEGPVSEATTTNSGKETIGGVAPQRIQYFASYSDVFQGPHFTHNLIYISIAIFIPVLNQVLLLGYLYETIELKFRGLTASYEKFEFRHFNRYLRRGVWPYLIIHVLQTLMIPVFQILTQTTVFGTMALMRSDRETGILIAAIVIPLIVLGFILFILLMSVLLTPVYLRAGLSQDFSEGFKISWIRDFLSRCWLETLIANLFMILVGLLGTVIGILLFCVGLLPISVICLLGNAAILLQLYQLYLARGGEPIPLKPMATDVPPVYQPPAEPGLTLPDSAAPPPEPEAT